MSHQDKYNFVQPLQQEIYFLPAAKRVTSNRITNFELTRVISIRAKQIEADNVVFTDVTGLTDPIQMATKEVYDRKCPLSVVRNLNSRVAEKWEVNELILL